ncbi:mediator of RNA polymerase II transcription subunit 25-like [Clavelina lepadiformis]|uniref:mediator of RNA polymerase II transcription subunit 25-like n=1 Tax=Clavelina lepadiformis TaxID=159417 RepID=UPI0040435FF1
MVISEEKETMVEFVVCVEATANMVSHWDVIKKQYLIPALQYFHRQSVNPTDLNSATHRSRYGLVLFHAADRAPDLSTQCITPTRNVNNFLKMLDSIQFSGGGGEHFSFIAEGLATTLQLFVDMSATHKSGSVGKYCFLISNTPPYEMACMESYNYTGLTAHKLAEKLKEMQVKLSVICPRHIAELQQIYLANNNNQPPLMNYAQDRRHLVLISGFRLPTEREPVLVSEVQGEEKSFSHQPTLVDSPAPMEVGPPVEVPPIARETIVGENLSFPQPPSVSVPGQLTNTQTINPLPSSSASIQITSAAVISQKNFASTPQAQQSFVMTSPRSSSVTTIRPVVNTATNIAPALPNTIIHQPTRATNLPLPTTSSYTQGTTGAQQLPSMPGHVMGDVPSSSSMGGQLPQPQYAEAQKEAEKVLNIAKAQQPDHKVLWSGRLEWAEKKKQLGPNPAYTKSVHQLQCEVSPAPNTNILPPVDTSSWPNPLNLQMIPQYVINGVSSFLRQARKVIFRFYPPSSAQELMAHMQKPMCGLINTAPRHQDAKVIIIILLKNKEPSKESQFYGFLPSDPAVFMEALRKSITTNKPMQPNMANSGNMNMQMQQQGFQSRPQYSQQGQFSQGQAVMPQVAGNQNTMLAQQQVNTGPAMSTITRITNVPMSTSQMGVRQQQSSAVMGAGRNLPQGNSNLQIGIGNMTSGSVSMTGNAGSAMSGGQRVVPAGMPISSGNKTNIVRIPQVRSMPMQGNPQVIQDQQQLRNLLSNNNSAMQQGNPRLRQVTANNMQQQQNFMQRGNMMNTMQNQQRRF